MLYRYAANPRVDEHLHVITCVINPLRFESRVRLYQEFAEHMHHSRVHLTTVEVAFGDRPFVVTCEDNPDHVQFRTREELWHKERAINIGIAHMLQLHPHANKIAWLDADIKFVRPDWASETVHQLDHFDFLQLFSHAQDVGPCFQPIGPQHQGFAYSYWRQLRSRNGYDYCASFHPGYAWAARRDALDKVGGLIDFAILGSADAHMALALVGKIKYAFHKRWVGQAYFRELLEWQRRAERHIRHNLGFVSGLVLHNWHGPKASRHYRDRWDVLIDNKFNPDTDLRMDSQGLWALNDTDDPRQCNLRDGIRRYFRQRDEDSTYVG